MYACGGGERAGLHGRKNGVRQKLSAADAKCAETQTQQRGIQRVGAPVLRRDQVKVLELRELLKENEDGRREDWRDEAECA